jgi:lipoprotein NlpD
MPLMVMPVRPSGVVFLLALLAACNTVRVGAPARSAGDVPQSPPASTSNPAAAQRPGYYTVRRGDTLYSVAWQNGLNFRQLAEMNGIRSPYTIYVGQSLRIAPAAGALSAQLPAPLPGPVAATSPTPIVATRSGPGAIATPKPVAGPGPAKASSPVTTARTPVPEPAAGPEPALPAVVSRWEWPTRGPLLRGYTPEANGKKGIDIGGNAGQPVRSAADGKVVYSGSGLVGYGRLIIIKHNDSLLSAYGHNSELLVTEGEYVKAGQVIAKMGSSGTSSTRLYFEIRQDGKPVNPLRYLPRG